MNKSETFTEYKYNEAPTEENVAENEEVQKYGYGIRHIQLMIFITCLIATFIARGHMGVTIVAMTNTQNHTENIDILNNSVNISNNVNKTNYSINFYNSVENSPSTNEPNDTVNFEDNSQSRPKTWDWPKSTQEIVLGSFFVGYATMMMPGGIICQRWGGKLLLQISLCVDGLVSIMTPWLTIWGGWKAVSLCRFLQGLSQAGTYPSLQALLGKWVPASERATLLSYVYTGTPIGNIIAFQLSGVLAESRYGWVSTFCTVGVISLSCFVLLSIFGAATPLEHKTISQAEKRYILSGIDGSIGKVKTPWLAIIKSKPLWGAHATHVGSTIIYVFFFIQVPSYVHHILGISVMSSGLLSSLPYIASLFFSIAFGWISDYCTNNEFVSIRNARIISNTISQCGIALSLICVSYTRDTTVAISFLVAAMIFHMATHTGWMVNHMDLAPNFTGIMMSTGNTLANIANTMFTPLVAYVITDMTNVIQWRIMFFIVAGIAIVTNAIFVFLMSSEVQPWNYSEYKDKHVEELSLKNMKQEN